MKIGVLALQGDFDAHQRMLRALQADSAQVRSPRDLAGLDGLVMPGGESTTMLKLLDESGLRGPLEAFAADKPVFGTCAGCILAAREVSGPKQPSFGWLDISIERNAYGRQVDSSIRRFAPEAPFVERTEAGDMEAVFIRAPIIHSAGPGVTVLLKESDHPVLVEEGRHLAATFHPELTSDLRVHRLFLEKVRRAAE